MMSGLRLLIPFTALLLGCAHAPAPKDAGADSLVEHVVRPQEADPGADRWLLEEYAVLDPSVPRAGKLVVYLVGLRGKPASGRAMLRELARMGFHALAPMYPNDYEIKEICAPAADADDDCHGKARLEAFEGVDHSPHLVVTRPNSAEERVARMLAHLHRAYPAEGWGAFLDGERPRWSSIVVSGHSHGASSAGLIGKVRRVDRVVMLSGPFDNRDGASPPWTRKPGATPPDRFYGLSHLHEPQYPLHVKNWETMGLGPLRSLVDVDVTTPPYSGSHQLATALPGGNPHGMTAAGPASPGRTPPDGDGYVLSPAWRYLFGR
jgi:hypothetical protein